MANRRGGGSPGFLSMRLDINLATQPYQDASRFWRLWGGALAGMILLTLVLVYTAIAGWSAAAKDRDLIRQREHEIAQRDQERQNAETLLSRPENRSTRDRSEFLNQLFERKAFSWTKVFEDLEQVMPPHLHVVAISPQMSPEDQLEIRLEVAGESRDRALELVRNMENSRHFQQTEIVQETDATAPASGDNVRFEISALYASEAGIAAPRGAP